MAQVRDCCFRVMNINGIDVDLLDLHTGYPVTIEIEHESYSEELLTAIKGLQSGYVIHAMVQSQDILHLDGIWRFLEIEVIETTLLTGIEEYEISEDNAIDLNYQIGTRGGAYKQFSIANDIPVTMIANRGDNEEWVRLNHIYPYKNVSNLLGESSEPPYEIIHQWDKDKNIIRSYYIGDIETEFAEAAKSELEAEKEI